VAALEVMEKTTLGTSVGGRPIVALHRGTGTGVPIVVVGDIHGSEDAGVAIVHRLAQMPLPAGVDLWLIDTVNPDGMAAQVRGNGHGVDLNRNFPHGWSAIAAPGDWQYSGTGPASEPETKAFIAFAERVHPVLTLWYHQDLHRVSPSKGRDAPLRRRYAQLTGLSYETVSGGIYTGVAATWARTELPDSMSFIVELGPTLSDREAKVHAAAVLEIATMAVSVRAGTG
jgi:protein MpaA